MTDFPNLKKSGDNAEQQNGSDPEAWMSPSLFDASLFGARFIFRYNSFQTLCGLSNQVAFVLSQRQGNSRYNLRSTEDSRKAQATSKIFLPMT